MIPLPEAQAAYDRVTHFIAQPGDVETLIEASQQGGMPQPIVDVGSAVKADKEAFEAYRASPTQPNTDAWMAADTAMREALANHVDV